MVYWCIFESPIAAYVVGQHPDGVILHDEAHQGVESPDGQLVGGETAAILMEGILRLGSNGDADDGQHENDCRQPTNPFLLHKPIHLQPNFRKHAKALIFSRLRREILQI